MPSQLTSTLLARFDAGQGDLFGSTFCGVTRLTVFPLTMLHLYMFKPPQRCLFLTTSHRGIAIGYFEFSRRALQLCRLTESRGSILGTPTGVYRVSLKYSRVVSVAYPNRRGIASYILFPAVRPHARWRSLSRESLN